MNQDIRQTSEYANFLKDNGWKIEKLDNKNNCFILPIWGTSFHILKLQRVNHDSNNILKKINQLSKKYNSISTRIEMNEQENKKPLFIKALEKNGFVKSNWANTPTKTVIINLKQNIRNIYVQMHSAKRHIKNAEKQEIEIKIVCGNKIDNYKNLKKAFFKLIRNHGKKHNIPDYPKKWLTSLINNFNSNSWLIFSILNNEVICCGLFLQSKDTMAYVRGASNENGYRYDASYQMMWEAIRLAKRLKLYRFDLEGIYDDRYEEMTNSWKGFTQFKKAFGGKELPMTCAYEKKHKNNLSFWEKAMISNFMNKKQSGLYL